MATQLHSIGEEWERKYIFEGSVAKPGSVYVGLYHDGEISGDTSAGDDLTDSADYGDITTEPGDGNYSQQAVTFDSSGFSANQDANGNWYASVDNGVTFDVGNTTGTVDAYFVTIDWDRDNSGTAEIHLYFTGNLDQAYDLSQYTTLELGSVGLGQD